MPPSLPAFSLSSSDVAGGSLDRTKVPTGARERLEPHLGVSLHQDGRRIVCHRASRTERLTPRVAATTTVEATSDVRSGSRMRCGGQP